MPSGPAKTHHPRLVDSTDWSPMKEEGGTETVRHEQKMRNWLRRGGMIGKDTICFWVFWAVLGVLGELGDF